MPVVNTRYLVIALVLLATQVLTLYLLGQPWMSASGQILIWANSPLSPETSQQFADWYSLSHIVHGLLFYALLRLCCPRLKLGVWLLLAMGLEIAWEIAENTPMVIEAYRKQALAIGYTGDSILNSLMDTLMMALGFLFASRAPAGVSIALGLGLELLAGFAIRDNLTLNILNFLISVPFIEKWQAGYALTAVFLAPGPLGSQRDIPALAPAAKLADKAPMTRNLPAALAFCLLALPAMAEARVVLQNAWFRALPAGLPAGGYFTLRNNGAQRVVLTGAQSAACGMLMLHQSSNSGGTSSMAHVTSVDVPAGGSVAFAPNGYHLMCAEPKPEMKPGASVAVTLLFQSGEKLTANFAVRNAAGR